MPQVHEALGGVETKAFEEAADGLLLQRSEFDEFVLGRRQRRGVGRSSRDEKDNRLA